MLDCLDQSGQETADSEFSVMQLEGLGYWPYLFCDEIAGDLTDSERMALQDESEQSCDEREIPHRLATAEMFSEAARLRVDDLDRLLAEGSEPYLD